MIARAANALAGNVLVLNRYYSAIHVLSVRKSFCLLSKGAAEVVCVEEEPFRAYDFSDWIERSILKIELEEHHSDEEWIQSVNFQVQVPRIIRLVSYDRFPRHVVKFNRRNIFLRDEHLCQYCGQRFGQSHLSLDHVVPRSRGGEMTWENIVSACLKCNVRKGGRTPQEAGMTLRQRPSKPLRNPAFEVQLAKRKYACWKKFL
jgi:5-methylcytosine-specific restriction endonuclease McrA